MTADNSRYYKLLSNDDALFWGLQAAGWTGISLLTYLSLSVPYDQYELSYLAHNVSQSALGFVLSVPLRYVYRAIWEWPGYLRLAVAVLSAIVFAAVWSALRLQLFMMMTGETGLWPDFGGWLFPSLFVFFTWAALYHGIKYYQVLQRQREILLQMESLQRQEALKLTQAESQARQAQLALLRYQLNPHFLFNTLNSMAALISVGQPDRATTMINKLSDYFRQSLTAEPTKEVPLSEEVATTDLYLEIERIRFADRLLVEIEIDPSTKQLLVPSMILQPLVENSLKHAIGRSEAGGRIRIRSNLMASGTLLLTVDDTGAADSAAAVTERKGSGVGLGNTEERLRAFYGRAATIRTSTSDLGGFSVQLQIPARAQVEDGS